MRDQRNNAGAPRGRGARELPEAPQRCLTPGCTQQTHDWAERLYQATGDLQRISQGLPVAPDPADAPRPWWGKRRNQPGPTSSDVMEAQRQLRQTSEAIKAIADDLDQACLLQSYDDVTTGDWGSPGGRPETCS